MSLEKYCCGTLGTHDTICGNEKRKGGISAVFIVKLDTVMTDWEDPIEWAAEILAGNIILIQEIRGEYPEASEIENERLIGCGNETELDGFDMVMTWQDRAVNQANNDFYEELNGCTYHFGWFDCQQNGDDKIFVIEDAEVNFVCKPPIVEAAANTIQRYMCSAKWTADKDQFPVIYDAPAGTFS